MKKLFSNPYILYGTIILVVIGLFFGGKALYNAGRKAELESRLARINDTLQTLRVSDESHLKLLAMRESIIEKLSTL